SSDLRRSLHRRREYAAAARGYRAAEGEGNGTFRRLPRVTSCVPALEQLGCQSMADKRDTSDGIPQARTPEQAADQPPEVADEADARKPAVEAAAAQVAAQPDTESRPDEGADAVPTRQVEQVASQPIPLSTSTVPGAWWDAAWEALRHPDQPPRRLAELAV